MKKQKFLKKGKIFLVLLLLLNGSLFSQTWDNVAFSNYYNVDAAIDNSDNIYSFTDTNTGEKRVIKYNSQDAQAWNVNISSHLGLANYITGHIATNNTKVFAAGYSAAGGGTKIIQMDSSNGGNISNWELLGSTMPSYNEIKDIKIVGNEMYVLGHFNGTMNYNNGASSLVSNAGRSSYLIKYTIAPKAVLWAKKIIDCSSAFEASSLDVDASGTIFVTGFYKGTMTLNDGSTNFNFTNSTANDAAFLVKLTAAGNYDTAFGLKQVTNASSSNLAGSEFAVNANGLNNTVYFSVLEKVFAYSKIGSGANLWTRNFPTSRTVVAIGVNRCGDVYVSGQNANDEKAVCSGDFFADLLNKNNGNTVWTSVSTSCHSVGSNLLFNSANKLKSVGGYKNGSSNQNIVIDNQFTTSLSYGSFIGTFDDQPVNSCCDITINLPSSVSMCGTFSALCGPTPPAGSTYTYQWWGPSNNTSVILGTSQCFTPTQAGGYLLKVTNQFGCTVSQAISIVNSIPSPELGSNITICKGDVFPIVSIANQGFETGGYTIKWYINGVLVQTGGVTLQVSPSTGGTISVVISKSGCTSTDGIKVAIKNCDPTACFVLKNILSEANEDSKYGPQSVKKLCKERVEIDGSCSENESGYHVRIAEFDLVGWNFIQDYYSGWVNATAQAPATINLNTLIGTPSAETGFVSRTFLTNKLYMVNLSVGPVWNSAQIQFFRVVSCARGESEFVKVEKPDLENKALSSLEVFPNPTNGKVTIDLNGINAEEVLVYNTLGKIVYKATVEEKAGNAGIDLTGLPSGIYIVHVKTHDGQTAIRKIIKN